MEVDHFDPRKKNDYIQDYENLYLAKRACNLRKSNNWPSPDEEKLGVRFLDPCKEKDYDDQIFEDPSTHLLWGATPAGKYQIRMCGLNSPNLVAERRERHSQRTRLLTGFARLKPITTVDPGVWRTVQELIKTTKADLDKMIPAIELKPQP